MEQIKGLYLELKKLYNTKNWWPIYDGKEPFIEISIGAILTQNTNWKNVEKALKNLIEENLLTGENLRKVDEKRLQSLIKPAGFYRRKAKTIKEFVEKIKNKNIDELDRDFLLSIKGIGKETADSILLFALNRPFFIVDTYTKRLFLRTGIIGKDISYDKLQEMVIKEIGKDPDILKEFHGGIVEHSKNYCRKKPLCENCPLEKHCSFISHTQQESF